MVSRRCKAQLMVAAVLTCLSSRGIAQSRSDENAVTQAEDGFGFSVGRESLGIYNSGNARGFSPTAAGNLRIDGLYFDQEYALQGTLVGSVSIKVGLSAQGYPFGAPSGIVDQELRRPANKPGASVVANSDSYGTRGIEVDGSVPVSSSLSFGYGLNATHTEFPDGTNNWTHTETLIARWRPSAGIEIRPFWAISNDYEDEAGTFFVPAGDYLPRLPRPRRNEGPDWADFRYTGLNSGVLVSVRLAQNWLLRLGAFRSVNDLKHSYTHILDQEQPNGTGERILFADPPNVSSSNSGELRLTHSITDGPRLHVVHFSIRRRDALREFGGSDFIDLGPGRIGEKVTTPKPDRFDFGEPGHDRVSQTMIGVAYDGRWRNVGEISFGISKADFHKKTDLPDVPVAITRSKPLIYNGTAATSLSKAVSVYAGYSRGLEENGTAPPSAANRNEPLPAILTQQKDAGLRFAFNRKVKAVVGIFELSKPYFSFDALNVYKQVGRIQSKGAEFSLSGNLTPRIDVVTGGVFLDPKVTADQGASLKIGSRPVGVPSHIFSMNINWRTLWVKGLELDMAVLHRGRTPATTNNAVFLPSRARVDLGGHYRFRIANRHATLRLQLVNLFDNAGYGLAGSGVYASNPGRYVQGYLTVDL